MINFIQLFDLIRKTSFTQPLKIKKFHDSALTYARNFMTTYCVCALFNVGFFDEIAKNKVIKLDIFIKGKDLNKGILAAICDYLFVVGILDKIGKDYSLTTLGRSILKYARGTFDFIYAYAPLFENLDSLLANKKKYNIDVFRRNKFVAKATAEVSQFIPIPVVKDIIKRNKFNAVLDLGCGSAEFLLQLCEDTKLNGYGIDIAGESISFAQDLINSQSLSRRVKVKVGDVFDIKELKNISNDIDVITCMFVLHEFLPLGKDRVTDLLRKIKQSFPDKHLIVCELSRFRPDFLRKNPTSIAEHHLFHALSGQGLMTPSEWQDVFSEAGLQLVEEKRYDFAGQVYFVLSL